MSLTIAQDFEYLGSDQWKWSVWLGGADRELDEVKFVEYILHPTFPNPIRKVTDRSSRFRLETQGWGVFQLTANVRMNDASVRTLTHMLELAYPDVENTAPTRGGGMREPPDHYSAADRETDVAPSIEPSPEPSESEVERAQTIFLSAGSADSVLASEIRGSLIDRGVGVWTDEDLSAGAPWEVQIMQAIEDADAVIVLSSDIPSKWVEREVKAAEHYGRKVIQVTISDSAVLPRGLETHQSIHMSSAEQVDSVTESIVRALEG